MADSATELAADDVGLPRFELGAALAGDVFDLSSHRRAREALEFGLAIDKPGFNIFVLGEDRSGRMTNTLEFLNKFALTRPPPADWLYLNDFRWRHRPRPCRLPNGVGRRFRDELAALIPSLREALTQAFGTGEYQRAVQGASQAVRTNYSERLEALRGAANANGLEIASTPQGPAIQLREDAPAIADADRQAAARHLAAELGELHRWASQQQVALGTSLMGLNHAVAEHAVADLLDQFTEAFNDYSGLARWLVELRDDVLNHYENFLPRKDESGDGVEPPERRYAVNLLVDNSEMRHGTVLVEPNPTYENLFGKIEYRQTSVGMTTDFTQVRAGSLHRANGGILVLRTEALAGQPAVWQHLKAALRDREIALEEPHRAGMVPVADAPRPKPVRLSIKIVLVGAPRWFYSVYYADPDFQTYFKIKADIDPDMAATPENVACYAGLLRQFAKRDHGAECETGALQRLLGVAARWASDRGKLSARFEMIEDLIGEAAGLAEAGPPRTVTEATIVTALANRRRRNARAEDRTQEAIADGRVMIATQGTRIGQVNALTVRETGDHVFGAPSRVTARTSIGRHGIVNIERVVDLGGPIQQKGVLILQGFLMGRFARRIPLSFNGSLTFEQSYGGVEGDSASLAELVAILSDLADAPLRQDIAITGALNQNGEAQAVGGVHWKVEGFFRACLEAGPLTGNQGVVIPRVNHPQLVLRDEVVAAVREGKFHLWCVDHVDQALALFTGLSVGEADSRGDYPADSVHGRVAARLGEFDRVLAERERM